MSLEIHAGDFPKRTLLVVSGKRAHLQLPWQSGDGWSAKSVALDQSTVADLSIASEESAKRFLRSMGMATVGALAVGLPGLMAGALAGGNKKRVTFVLQLKDGRRMLATTDGKTWTKLQSALF
jgi:hypothetical protein